MITAWEVVRSNWIALAIILFMSVAWADSCRDETYVSQEYQEALEEAQEWKDSTSVLEGALRASQEALILAQTEADSLQVIADSTSGDLDGSLDDWNSLPDNTSADSLQATGDSLAQACAVAQDAWQEAMLARMVELNTAYNRIDLLTYQVNAEHNRAEALEVAVAELEDRLQEGDSLWPTVMLTAGGAGIGYALDGAKGAFVGAGVGVSLDIARRGIKSLLGSL